MELAQYDLDSAKVTLDGGRYLYVGFMCHQTIEKSIKSYYVFTKIATPPYTHNLVLLAKESGIYDKFTDDQKNFLDVLGPLNTQARYPTYKEKLMRSLTKEICRSDCSKHER
ncbi:MAG: HEPN domain-containing protein [Armatimonadota bacterium]